MKSDEERLRELFETNDKPTPSFNNTIKRAKTFSIIRNIIISLMIFITLSAALLIANSFILNHVSNKKLNELHTWFQVAMPNAYMGNTQADDRIMIGEIEYPRYRFLGEKPIVDGIFKEDYSYMPLIDGNYGDMGHYLFSSSGESFKELEEMRKYNKVGKLVMKFYHPLISYDKYINDLEELNNIEKDKLMEISLSFDKSYSLEEAKALIPEGITLNWYWVDTLDKNNKDKLSKSILEEDEVYGIKALDKQGRVMKNPEESFIDSIICGNSNKDTHYRYKSLFNVLSGGKTEINKEDLRIIGVVVSGDVETLKALKNLNYIKAATIGAVADKY